MLEKLITLQIWLLTKSLKATHRKILIKWSVIVTAIPDPSNPAIH